MIGYIFSLSALSTFGHRASKLTGWPYVKEAFTGTCDVVFIVGMYDPPLYQTTLEMTKHAKRRHIHWCGSDVEALVGFGCADNLPEATHSCESEGLQRELLSAGVHAEVMPMATSVHAPVTPFPEKPRLAAYYGTNPNKYGADWVRFISDAFPDLEIETFVLGQHPDVTPVIERTNGLIRIMDHDGSANTAREWMEAGRAAITTTDLPYADIVSKRDPSGVLAAVRDVISRKEPNKLAAEWYAKYNSTETWKETFDRLMEE